MTSLCLQWMICASLSCPWLSHWESNTATAAMPSRFAGSQLAVNSNDQDSIQIWYRQSNQLRAEGNYKKSIELAEKVLQEAPDNSNLLIHIGSCHYMLGQMKEAVDYYDRAIKADPKIEPQLWQRGLALYYLDRFKDGQKQFETHQTYNTQDVENAVWHMLCQAKASDLETARQDLIPIQRDTRVPMKQIHQLYAGEASVDDVMAAAKSTEGEASRKEALYYAHLYIGLYQEMIGQSEQSIASMKQAVEINPIPKQYLMGQVAAIHLKLRVDRDTSKAKGVLKDKETDGK